MEKEKIDAIEKIPHRPTAVLFTRTLFWQILLD